VPGVCVGEDAGGESLTLLCVWSPANECLADASRGQPARGTRRQSLDGRHEGARGRHAAGLPTAVMILEDPFR
jgi:hypothetical protein